MIYFTYILLLFFLVFHYDIRRKTKCKDTWYVGLCVATILIAGLRYRLGVDTIQYIDFFYHEVPYLGDFQNADKIVLWEPLYFFINSIVKSLGGKFYVVQLIQASIVNLLIFKYIKKHSDYVFMCVLFYFIWLFFSFTMEEMRASISVAICLFGNDYFLERKRMKGFLLYAVAFLFHNSTIILFITPFLLFLKFNLWGSLFLVVTPIFGLYIQNRFGEYLLLENQEYVLLMKAQGYINNDKYLVEHNLFYYLVDIGIYVYYSVLSICCIRNKDSKIRSLQPFLLIGLFFLMLQSNLGILYRVVNFYLVYFILFFVEYFMSLIKKSSLDIKLAFFRSIVIFLPFFYVVSTKYLTDYKRYYPYSSVIERDVDRNREALYHHYRTDVSLLIRENEY